MASTFEIDEHGRFTGKPIRPFAFGEGTSPLDAAAWASAMTHVNGDDGLSCVVPIADLEVHWDPERSKQMFDYIKKDETADIPGSLCTPTGLPKSVTG